MACQTEGYSLNSKTLQKNMASTSRKDVSIYHHIAAPQGNPMDARDSFHRHKALKASGHPHIIVATKRTNAAPVASASKAIFET